MELKKLAYLQRLAQYLRGGLDFYEAQGKALDDARKAARS